MNRSLIIIIGIIVVLVGLPILMGISSYNSLVELEERVDADWAQVENVLKRRADLIPNLVNTVKGFAKQEQDVLIGVTEARSKVMIAKSPEEYAAANQQLTSALQGLNVVVEKYPELKSDKNFLALQDELSGTENRITTARRDYNEAVQRYNKKVKRFPSNVFAGMFGFEKRAYFEIDESDKEVPKVEF